MTKGIQEMSQPSLAMQRRIFRIGQSRTQITMLAEFWHAFDEMVTAEGIDPDAVVAEAQRASKASGDSVSSVLSVRLLSYYRYKVMPLN